MSDYKVNAVLGVDDKGFTSGMKSAINTINQVSESASSSSAGIAKMGIAFGAASAAISTAMGAIKNSLSSAISRFDTLNQFPKMMNALGFESEQAEKALDKLAGRVDQLPTALDDVAKSTQSIAQLTGNLDEATDIALALNDAFLASGSSSADASRGLTQYTQMLSAGKVDMQSWKTLLETMGVALNDVAAEFGYTGKSAKNDLYNALQSGEITFDQFNKALVNLDNGLSSVNDNFVSFADRALTATEGLATGFENIQQAMSAGLANMLTAIDEALSGAGLGKMSDMLNGIRDGISNAFTVINGVIKSTISAIAPVFKLLADNMDKVMIVVGGLVTKFVALKIINTVKGYVDKLKTSSKQAASELAKYKDLLSKYTSKQEARAKADEDAARANEALKKAQEAEARASEAATVALEAKAKAAQASAEAAKAGGTNAELNARAQKAEADSAVADANALNAKAQAERANLEATKAVAQAEKTNADAITMSTTQISLKDALLGVLSGKYTLVEAGQLAWNAAMNANPIGLVVTAITGLVTAISFLSNILGGQKSELDLAKQAHEELKNAIEETISTYESARDEYEENVKSTEVFDEATNQLVEDIVRMTNEIDEANKKGEDTSQMTEDVAGKVQELNGRVDGLGASYDKQRNALSMTNKQLQRNVEIQQKRAKLDEIDRRIAEATQSEKDSITELTAAQDEAVEHTEKLNDVRASFADNLNDYTVLLEAESYRALAESAKTSADEISAENERMLAEQESLAMEKARILEEISALEEEAEADTANAYAEYEAKKRAELEATLATNTLTLDQLTEANQATVSELKGCWDDYYEAASTLFERLNDDVTVSVSDMIQNIEHNQEVVANWGNNMQSLRERFASLRLDTAILDQLQTMGVEGAGHVNALVQASDAELSTLATDFGKAGQTATDALYKSIGVDQSKVPQGVKNLVTETKKTLSTSVKEADWADIGDDIAEGFTQGIESGFDDATNAGEELAGSAEDGTRDKAQTHSPSRVFDSIGKDLGAGLVNGMNAKKGAVQSASYALANASQTAFRNLASTFRQYGAWAGEGFVNGLSSMAGSVQAVASRIASSASSTIQRSLKIGSPSKVMEKLGYWTGEGYVNGLENRERVVADTCRRISDNVASVFVPKRDNRMFAQAEVAFAGGMSSYFEDFNNSITGLNDRPIVIQNELDIDGRAFASNTATYMSEAISNNEILDRYRKGTR